MRAQARLLVVVMAVSSLFAITPLFAADTPKLAAPIYKGAVPAVIAEGVQVDPFYTASFGGVKALDCYGSKESYGFGGKVITAKEAEKEGNLPGPWCFLSRDPIDKVKAYYEKSIGTMHAMQGEWDHRPVQGYVVFAERAKFRTEIGTEDTGYTSVSVHALPPPPVKGKKQVPVMGEGWEGQEAHTFYAQSRHFGVFIDGVAWFGEPTKRKPAELDAVYKKHSSLESAFFQIKGPELEPVDKALHKHYDGLRAKRQQAAVTGTISAQMQHGMAAGQQGTAPSPQEDAEFNAIMKRKPELARKYVALTQKVGSLMQQGKFNEADEVLEEVEALEQSDPELAAWARKQEKRQASAQAAGKAQENKIRAAGDDQLDKAVWGTAMEYIKAIDKEAYYTLIVIDRAFRGNEKDYSRDRALIDKETRAQEAYGLTPSVDLKLWDIQYKQRATAGTPSSAPPAQVPDTAQQPQPEKKKEGVGDAAKEGLKKLKKLF